MDFISDCLSPGNAFRTLNIVDDYTRECLAIELALLSRANRQIRLRHWLTRRDTLVDRVKLGNRIRWKF